MSEQEQLLREKTKDFYPGLKTILIAPDEDLYKTVEPIATEVLAINKDAVEINPDGDILIHRGLLAAGA